MLTDEEITKIQAKDNFRKAYFHDEPREVEVSGVFPMKGDVLHIYRTEHFSDVHPPMLLKRVVRRSDVVFLGTPDAPNEIYDLMVLDHNAPEWEEITVQDVRSRDNGQ